MTINDKREKLRRVEQSMEENQHQTRTMAQNYCPQGEQGK